jgi:bifunctional UDP-N-acetylglucosamine pyrophosphorylase/glucosamine-1-phosphate N-acetyltransferase/UDP-N-acetylglucosamine pyrophosphorylase
MTEATAIVLAAGKGTRMKSDLPKVLVPIAGRPMIDFVLDMLDACGIRRQLIVVGYRADLVREHLKSRKTAGDLVCVEQTEQLGTGHAVMVCRPELAAAGATGSAGPVLIVTGDSPLVRPETIRALLAQFAKTAPACLMGTAHKENPHGLGRIVRDAGGRFEAIVEERDATDEQRKITEVNMSCYVFNGGDLLRSLDELKADNAQREYYLTDCPGLLRRAGRPVEASPLLTPVETLSINTPDELREVEQALNATTKRGIE